MAVTARVRPPGLDEAGHLGYRQRAALPVVVRRVGRIEVGGRVPFPATMDRPQLRRRTRPAKPGATVPSRRTPPEKLMMRSLDGAGAPGSTTSGAAVAAAGLRTSKAVR